MEGDLEGEGMVGQYVSGSTSWGGAGAGGKGRNTSSEKRGEMS